MPKLRKHIGIFLLSSAGALLCAGGAVAQQPPADTTAVFGFLKPTYTSSYDITRQATNWVQSFTFKNQLKGVSVDNTTNYTVRTDPGTHLKARGGDTRTTLDFGGAFPVLPMSLDFSYNKNGTDDPNNSTNQNTFESNLKATYDRRFLKKTTTRVVGGIGIQSRKTTTESSSGLTGSNERGLTEDLNASGTYNGPMTGMQLKGNATFNAVHTTPEIINPTAGQRADPRTNTRNSQNATATWSPNSTWSGDATINRSQSNLGYVVVSIDRNTNNKQELATDSNTGFTSTLGYHPPGNKTDYHLELKTASNNTQRRVEKERENQGSSVSLDARFKNTVAGATTILHMQNEDEKSNRALVGRDSTLTRAADFSVEKVWNPRLTTKAIGEIRLRSQKYLPKPGDVRQDADALKNRLESTVIYKMWTKLSVNLAGNYVSDHTVNIDKSQSRRSHLDETFGGNASLLYTLSHRTSITQKYSFTALFTSYEFDSALSTIRRTRSVTTTVNTDLTSKLGVGLSHAYYFQESGGYRRDEAGTRLFARGNLKYSQELRTTVSYKPFDWMSFGSEERFYRTDDVRVSNGNRSTSGTLTFTQRGNFKRPIPGGGNFSCDMSVDIEKTVQPFVGKPKKYFRASLSLDKSF